MQVIRAKCDAILMGSGSLRAYPKPLRSKRRGHHPANIIVSSRLSGISPKWEFFRDPTLHRILLVGPQTPLARIRAFSKCATVRVLPQLGSKSDTRAAAAAAARAIVRACKDAGIRHLLVEGGGEIIWLFVAANLIDRYFVTLTPKIVGGRDAPTLVEGTGLAPSQFLNLKLKSAKKVGDELYLIYERR